MIELHDRYGKMVRFAKYNCDKIKDEPNFEGIRQCRDNYEKNNFPNFYFFLPSENTFYPYNPQTFNFPKSKPRSSTPDGIDEMLQQHMPVFAKRISNIDHLDEFMNKLDAINRTLYFSNTA